MRYPEPNYACFQIACVALHQYNIINIGDVRKYRYQTIIGLFVTKLINEKQVYTAEMRGYLHELLDGRLIADYEPHIILSVEEATNYVCQAIRFYGMIRKSLRG